MKTVLPLAEQVGARLLERGETVAISESSSGGLISAALLTVSGASRFYRGAAVIYTPNAFRGLMGLDREDIGDMRSSSEPYAEFMAHTIKGRLRAFWGLCETGAAGPSGNGYGDPAGHTCVAVSGTLDGQEYEASRTLRTGSSDRIENMERFAYEALDLLRDTLG